MTTPTANPAIPDVLEVFEAVLVDRAGGGPAEANYDPELLMAGYDLIEEVKRLRASLGSPA